MKFSELSKGQKRCVLALFAINEELKSSSTTRRDIVETWNCLRDSGSKVGFPNWLLTSQFKSTKGFYVIPKPTAKDIEEYKNPPKKAKKPKVQREKKANKVTQVRTEFINNTLSQENMEYYSTLEKYGIPF